MAHQLISARRAATVGVLVLAASPFAGLSAAQAATAPHPSSVQDRADRADGADRQPDRPRPHRVVASPTAYAVPAKRLEVVVARAGVGTGSLL